MASQFARIPVRAGFVALAVTVAGLVGAGLVIQEIARLSPCPLCIFQRLLYLGLAAAAILGALWPAAWRWWGGAVAALAGGGLLVALYQSWMQAYPHLAPECSFTDPNLIERLVDWLGMQVPALFLATGFCASRDWTFLGLSMANWSVGVFAAILVLVVGAMRARCPG